MPREWKGAQVIERALVTMCVCMLSLSVMSGSFVTPWIVACQAPLSMGFPRQEYWSVLPFPPPGDFHSPGMEPMSLVYPVWQADSLPWKPYWLLIQLTSLKKIVL